MSLAEGANPPPTVVFVSGVTGHGGPNASLRAVVRRLQAGRRVLVGPYGEAEAAAWRAEGVEVEHMPRPRGFAGRAVAAWRLLRIVRPLRGQRPLVFANGLTEAAVLVPALLSSRVPMFVWTHNFVAPRIALACAPLLHRLPAERLALAAVSQMACRVAKEVFGPAAALHVVPNPIDSRFWSIERETRGEGPLRVAYLAGTDRRYKGFDLLPEIVEAADEAGIDWQVVAAEATQPDAWRRLREVIGRLRSSRVSLRGRSDRMAELYAATDVVLVSSRQESFCRVAAEAMASGAAVVAARLEAIEEVCGDVAFYFPPEDPRQAAAVLRQLAAAPHEAARAGARGRERARRFTLETVVGRLAELLRDLAERNGTT